MARRLGSLGATAEALRGLRVEKETEDRRDQSLIFQLAAHDPVAAEKAFNRRFPEFGTVSFRGTSGKFRYFTSDRGVFAIDQRNPLQAIQVEGIPGQKKMPTGVPLKIRNRLRLKGLPVDEGTVTEEINLEATETAAEKAQAEFVRLQGLLAGTDAQRNKATAEIDADVWLRHSLKPVIDKKVAIDILTKAPFVGKVPIQTGEFEIDEQRLREALARKFTSQALPEGAVRLRKGEREEAPTAEFEIGEGVAQRQPTIIRVEVTAGLHKGRIANVPEADFDPATMRRIR